jgi:voltage-gated potassium channel Kch
MIRFCYLFRIESILQKRTNEQFRYAYKLIISLITIIFLSTAIILEVENRYTRSQLDSRKSDPNVERSSSKWEIYQFHDVIYFEFVTLTTIGFGDLTPKSDLGRLGTIGTIVIIIAVIPALYSKMSIVF